MQKTPYARTRVILKLIQQKCQRLQTAADTLLTVPCIDDWQYVLKQMSGWVKANEAGQNTAMPKSTLATKRREGVLIAKTINALIGWRIEYELHLIEHGRHEARLAHFEGETKHAIGSARVREAQHKRSGLRGVLENQTTGKDRTRVAALKRVD